MEDNSRYWRCTSTPQMTLDSEIQLICDLSRFLFMLFGFLAPNDFKFIRLSYIWALSVLDKGHSSGTKFNIHVLIVHV